MLKRREERLDVTEIDESRSLWTSVLGVDQHGGSGFWSNSVPMIRTEVSDREIHRARLENDAEI